MFRLTKVLAIASFFVSLHCYAEINSLCESNQIQTFRFKGVSKYTEHDYCQLSVEQVPAAIREFILSLGSQHKKVASLFNLSVNELFQSVSLDFRMQSSSLGALSSGVNTNDTPIRFYYGIFPDWDGDELEKGIYTHEIGHILSHSHNPFLPKSYLELSSTPLALETVADALAIESEGTVMGDVAGDTTCMKRARKIDSEQSYNFAEEFFTNKWSARTVQSCCRKILSQNPNERHWGLTCKNIISEAKLSDPLPPVDRTLVFDPHHYEKNPSLFDPHQLGIPLNSFLMDLQEQTQSNSSALFLQAFESASHPGPDYSHFQCRIPKLEGVIPVMKMDQVSMGTVLNRLRSAFSSDKRELFDQAWKKHAIDKAVTIGNLDAKALAEKKIMPSFANFFMDATQDSSLQRIIQLSGCTINDIGFFNPITKTWSPSGLATPGCGIICEN